MLDRRTTDMRWRVHARALALALLLLLESVSLLASAEYTESLALRVLPRSSKVHAHFHFQATSDDGAAAESHVPLVLQQMLTKYGAQSLQLSFALGKHSDARYGVDPTPAPFGAQLQVQLQENGGQGTTERWRGITSELGGLFSASLNQMDSTVVHAPLAPATPKQLGSYPEMKVNNETTLFLQATLAREELCTENLTPWLKMLPCRSIAGLGRLIDPIQLVSGEYLSLSLFVSVSPESGKWSLHQHLTTVQNQREGAKWTLQSLFFDRSAGSVDNQPLTACPLAAKSEILTQIGQSEVRSTDLKTQEISLVDSWLKIASMEENAAADVSANQEELVSVHAFVTGYGQVHGGVAVRLENNHPHCAMHVTYHSSLPWYLRLYFNTFQSQFIAQSPSDSKEHGAVRGFRFIPAELRGRPNQIYVQALLPPKTTLLFSIQLEKAFLRLSEHPPDANRGFDIPSGVATFQALDQCSALANVNFTATRYSEPLLVPLPTPDFSMPYNVITMTSTVVAFFVGSMLNTLLRKAPRIKELMAKDKKTG